MLIFQNVRMTLHVHLPFARASPATISTFWKFWQRITTAAQKLKRQTGGSWTCKEFRLNLRRNIYLFVYNPGAAGRGTYEARSFDSKDYTFKVRQRDTRDANLNSCPRHARFNLHIRSRQQNKIREAVWCDLIWSGWCRLKDVSANPRVVRAVWSWKIWISYRFDLLHNQ